ncbi:NAD(P)-dependent alcohol dehydrogenase [Roseisalinus antarcticus]|uniref:Phthiocerol synthesis polyketide synthase type I PpsC n=1 Tax=Roseisalinus antarcticus TaxID=254357 RepID=A0A1Y5RF12_9RHOB|nr:NAD(P)-dependent alcohol dehydrogenase [Roseisalinus antarcticus]SLN15728.1 Phthiocerol synthesis polyketide synthase type I PpsC [Roseisalinus antarcticus]
MRAWVYDRYGGPDGLRLEELPDPVPKANQVLIRIEAVGLNGSDWEYLTGRPAYARLNGLRAPRKRILGSDITGRVEACGAAARAFAPDDAVLADILTLLGGLAEKVAVPETLLVRRPEALSPVVAASLPQSGAIAVQGTERIEAGQRVLINGAGGSAGAHAVTLTARAGAEVTAVDKPGKLAGLRKLGAAHTIDCTAEDFTRNGQRYDHILDLFGTRSSVAIARALAPRGRYRIVGGHLGAMLGCGLLGPLITLTDTRSIGIMALQQRQSVLHGLTDRLLRHEPGPPIDSTFPFEDTPAAFARLRGGESVGKIVVRMV